MGIEDRIRKLEERTAPPDPVPAIPPETVAYLDRIARIKRDGPTDASEEDALEEFQREARALRELEEEERRRWE